MEEGQALCLAGEESAKAVLLCLRDSGSFAVVLRVDLL